jgi:hypothetical protein
MDGHANHEMFTMIIIMFIAGILSTMNIWADKPSDVILSLNDIYMAALMIGWGLLLSGLYYAVPGTTVLGAIVVIFTLILIRRQIFVNDRQFMKGMIPHHSMAVTMSKNIIEKTDDPEVKKFAEGIIDAQEKEIDWMRSKLNYAK